MYARFALGVAVLGSLALSGCARLSLNNGSAEYKNTQAIAPLNIPETIQMRPQQPLYPAPRIDERALANAPRLLNEKGNRYELPRAAQPDSNSLNVGESRVINNPKQLTSALAPSKPSLIVDGNQNPLLKVEGNRELVWQYTLAAISTANLKTVATKDKNSTEQVEVQYNQQSYRIRLTPNGSNQTIAVYTLQNSFAEKAVASEILSSIEQNWVKD